MSIRGRKNHCSHAGRLFIMLALVAIGGLTGSAVLAANSYEELAGSIDMQRVVSDLQTMEQMGSRVSGYPGNQRTADMILAEFKRLGLETMVQEYEVPVPVDPGSYLEVDGKRYHLDGLWPNLARTSQVDRDGLSGPVIYVGAGTLSDFNAKDVQGAIVLMDFNTQQNWINAPLLGAAAVLFVEPLETTRGEAEMKLLRVPVDLPRFYVGGDEAAEILAKIAEGDVAGTIGYDEPMIWESRVNRNIIGILPGKGELGQEAIILEAYYDSMSIVPARAPGASDACGIASLLEIARLLTQYPPSRTVVFLACSGHFEALAGSREFVNLWGQEPRKERYRDKRLKELNRELKELEKALETTQTRLAEAAERLRELEELREAVENAGAAATEEQKQLLADTQRELQIKPAIVLVGQLEISPAAADERVERLQRYLANKSNDIRIWERLNTFDELQMFIGLDLSTHNDTLGAFQVGWFFQQAHLLRFYSPIGKQLTKYAEAAAAALGYHVADVFVDGINPVKGREWHTFFPGKIAFDHEMVIRGGRPGFVFTTVNDARSLIDTPLDTVDNLNITNLQTQLRMLACLLTDFLNEPELKEVALKRVKALKKMDDLDDVKGDVLEFRRRESFVPNTPVPNALVVVQGTSRMMMGVHTEAMAMANETSEFIVRGEMAGRAAKLEAYGFSPRNGDIVYAPDQGPDGDKKYPREVYGRAGLKRPVVVFHCCATDIFDLVDERYFQTLQKMFVYDAKNNSTPISYGFSLPTFSSAGAEFPSYVEPCATVYSLPVVDLEVTMGMGLLGVRMILINSTEKNPEGAGFRAANTPSIPLTPLQAAHDMWTIDEYRMKRLAERGITNARLDNLHKMAAEALELAKKYIRERDYDKGLAAARHAWGYESRAYPDVQRTSLDVVKGVLFYLALLLPFAYFGERLLISSRTVIGTILGTVGVFIVVFMALAMVHPAFKLTANPPIILLAFIIMALAVMVITIVTMKFNEQLKAMKQSRGGVHEADVGRLSATTAAFNLGLANMRRRKVRTILTAITLILLTFTVISFTSVVAGLRVNEIKLPFSATYQGVMLRDRSWLSLESPTADIIQNEFERTATVSPRAWYTSPQIDKELMIDVTNAADTTKAYTISCILGLSPQEEGVMTVEDLIVAGRWIRPEDKNACLIPTGVADALQITQDNIGSAEVIMFGSRYRVIGILSEEQMRKLRDLDGEPLMPVNYALLRPEILKELQRQAEQRSQLGASSAGSLLQEYKHFGPEKLIILPYNRVLELGGTLRSIAIKFKDAEEVLSNVQTMMKRFALSLYTGSGDSTYLFSSVGVTSLSGMESIIIPILIAALIVLNTMLGAVHERTGEIHIYSSLGLAPSHISMLFLAEASVFAVLGAIVGYLMGQVLTKILLETGSMHGLELNYSSLAAIAVTIISMAVVVLSTLYPSKKASEIASPGIERHWSLPDPDGDIMTIVLPFTVTGRDAYGVSAFLKEFFDEYVGYAGGDFLAEDVRLESDETEHGEGMAIRLRMWLAPYDLGVSQDFALLCEATGDSDIFAIVLRLNRLAGDINSWKKTNTLFLGQIRKQFLIWRTVPQGEKVAYAERADQILEGTYEEAADLL